MGSLFRWHAIRLLRSSLDTQSCTHVIDVYPQTSNEPSDGSAFVALQALGVHVKRCECGHVCSIEYNSCRHRSCPQCQGARKAEWLQKMTEQLLPCGHTHVIFTVPEELNPFWQVNPVNSNFLA